MVWLFQYLVFSLIFALAYGRSWLSHVDEQSIMPINLFNLFDSFWTDPWSLIRWSLVQFFQETVCRLIMSAAERLFENLIIGREAKLRGQMRNFEDSLSAKDSISRQTSEPEIVIYFKALPLIFISRVDSKFYLLSATAFEISIFNVTNTGPYYISSFFFRHVN